MITVVEQGSSKETIWVSEFQPSLKGLTLGWLAWTLYVRSVAYPVVEDSVTFVPDAQCSQMIRLWLSPRAEDGYLHLDVILEDGQHEPVVPETWPEVGQVLLLWGTIQARASEPELYVLRHVEEAVV